MSKRKQKRTDNKWTIAGVIVAIVAVIIAVPVAYIQVISYENSLPSPKLDVQIYDWYVNTTLNQDNTTYIGLNTTFPSYITNTGNVPVHIVDCDVFQSQNGNPINDSGKPLYSEIAYLKPQDSISYNFTKYFNISIPVNKATLGDLYDYLLVVGYYTQNPYDIKYVWISPPSVT